MTCCMIVIRGGSMTVTGERQFEKRLFPAGLADVRFVCCVIMIRWRSMTVTGERKFERRIGSPSRIRTCNPEFNSERVKLKKRKHRPAGGLRSRIDHNLFENGSGCRSESLAALRIVIPGEELLGERTGILERPETFRGEAEIAEPL